MQRARPRARRSRYHVSYRLTRSVPAAFAAVLLLVVIIAATLTYKRFDDFITATTGHHLNPIGVVVQAVEPAQGTIAYKLKHGQQVNILLRARRVRERCPVSDRFDHGGHHRPEEQSRDACIDPA